MKQIIENYRMGQAQLKTRVAQLKNSLSDRTLSLMERQNLDRRRRLLLEEYYEMEHLIRTVLPNCIICAVRLWLREPDLN